MPQTELMAWQLQLRNALNVAKPQMRISDELSDALNIIVTMLGLKSYVPLGIGDDVASMTPEVTLFEDRLVVADTSSTAGVVTFQKARYDYDVRLTDVVLEGALVSYRVRKDRPNATVGYFTKFQLPLLSDNVTVEVTIQPGGYLTRAVLLNEIAF